jgi:hypothetical protein
MIVLAVKEQKEPNKPEKLRKKIKSSIDNIVKCSVDIDSVAVSAMLDKSKLLNNLQKRIPVIGKDFTDFIDLLKRFVNNNKNDCNNNNNNNNNNEINYVKENLKPHLNIILEHWSEKIIYVLTGGMTENERRLIFNQSFISGRVIFTRLDIFTKRGKQNIIEKINNRSEKYYWIPSQSSSPFHFSISILNSNMDSGNYL